jgi:hypothetical protein
MLLSIFFQLNYVFALYKYIFFLKKNVCVKTSGMKELHFSTHTFTHTTHIHTIVSIKQNDTTLATKFRIYYAFGWKHWEQIIKLNINIKKKRILIVDCYMHSIIIILFQKSKTNIFFNFKLYLQIYNIILLIIWKQTRVYNINQPTNSSALRMIKIK